MSRVAKILVILFICTVAFVAGAYASERGAYQGFPIAKVLVNGLEVTCDVPAIVVDGRTLVPLRIVAEALGVEVDWNSSNKTVYINSVGSAEDVVDDEKVYGVGDEVQLAKAVVVVKDISYSTRYQEYSALDGYRFAIMDLKVKALADPPGKFKKISDVFSKWNLSNGSSDATYFVSGTNPFLHRNQWVEGTVIARIPFSEIVTSVEISDTERDSEIVFTNH